MEVLRKYNAATTINFPLVDRGTTDFETTPVTFAAGDTKIKKDEGASANTGSNPAHEGEGTYSLALTATEMLAARIVITVKDQTATKEWEDQAIIISTYGNASAQHAFDLDTANVTVGTNNDKTGYALSAAGIDSIIDEVIEGSTTLRQMMRLFASALIGKASGLGGATALYRDVGDTKNRITATVDADGNRSAVTLDSS